METQNFSWRLTGQNVSCPQILISARLEQNGQLVTDLQESSSKQVLFPNIVSQLTGSERAQLVEDIVWSLVKIYQNRIE